MKTTLKYGLVALTIAGAPAFAEQASNPFALNGWLGLEAYTSSNDDAQHLHGEVIATAQFSTEKLTFGAGATLEFLEDFSDDDSDQEIHPFAFAQIGKTRLTYGTIEDAEDHLLYHANGAIRFYGPAYDRGLDFEDYTARLDTEFDLANDAVIKVSASLRDEPDDEKETALAVLLVTPKSKLGVSFEAFDDRDYSIVSLLGSHQINDFTASALASTVIGDADAFFDIYASLGYQLNERLNLGATYWYENDDGDVDDGVSLQANYAFNDMWSASFATSTETDGSSSYEETSLTLMFEF